MNEKCLEGTLKPAALARRGLTRKGPEAWPTRVNPELTSALNLRRQGACCQPVFFILVALCLCL